MVLLFVLAAVAAAQAQPERRVIEVSGSAEQMVTPNEFTFKITLQERIENKQKVTIEEQETNLRSELNKLGVDIAKDLSIYDISSTYFRQKKLKDVLSTKDFRLKIRDLNKIAQLQELADRLNANKLEMIETDHSEITRLRRETKTEAMKAAKLKADYLLAAIGQKVGAAVFIKEVEEGGFQIDGASGSSNTFMSNVRRGSAGVTDSQDNGLSFSPIKLRFVIIAKFEIE
jgi:uncharacterized protein YggE